MKYALIFLLFLVACQATGGAISPAINEPVGKVPSKTFDEPTQATYLRFEVIGFADEAVTIRSIDTGVENEYHIGDFVVDQRYAIVSIDPSNEVITFEDLTMYVDDVFLSNKRDLKSISKISAIDNQGKVARIEQNSEEIILGKDATLGDVTIVEVNENSIILSPLSIGEGEYLVIRKA